MQRNASCFWQRQRFQYRHRLFCIWSQFRLWTCRLYRLWVLSGVWTVLTCWSIFAIFIFSLGGNELVCLLLWWRSDSRWEWRLPGHTFLMPICSKWTGDPQESEFNLPMLRLAWFLVLSRSVGFQSPYIYFDYAIPIVDIILFHFLFVTVFGAPKTDDLGGFSLTLGAVLLVVYLGGFLGGVVDFPKKFLTLFKKPYLIKIIEKQSESRSVINWRINYIYIIRI